MVAAAAAADAVAVGVASSANSSAASSMSEVRGLYEQIESIKRRIGANSGDKPEQWIQRQNLQDLFHQIILKNLDFTIDKKLEQDLWNLVFKSQINHFQGQIRESSKSAPTAASSAAVSSSTSASLGPQKRMEAQASLFFFLEAARGFYTKLLQDIVIAYDGQLGPLPFCQRYTSLFDRIDAFAAARKKSATSTSTSSSAKEKQVLYICQHILTHLGDIARYANLFEQARNYYMHAIKLVPYLGQPYNQLGILYETSRTNQLATAFYYVRSIAVRYTFPLAATNLDNFFRKLAETPLSRYHPALADHHHQNHQNETVLVKLPHKDLVTLFLQVNAFVCLGGQTAPQKVGAYLDVFKASFGAFLQTPLQRDKLDACQLCQMLAVLFYSLTQAKEATTTHAVSLLLFLVEQMVALLDQGGSGVQDLALPGLYLALGFVRSFQQGRLFAEHRLCSQSSERAAAPAVAAFVRVVNALDAQREPVAAPVDYPLNEDRMLESFVPLTESQRGLDFRRYMGVGQLLGDAQERQIRLARLLDSVERLAEQAGERAFVLTSSAVGADSARFVVNERLFPGLAAPKRLAKTQSSEEVAERKPAQQPPSLSQSTSPPTQQQHQQQRKKRTNVAIASMTQRQPTGGLAGSATMPAISAVEQAANFLTNLSHINSLSQQQPSGFFPGPSGVGGLSDLNGFPLKLPDISGGQFYPTAPPPTVAAPVPFGHTSQASVNSASGDQLDRLLKDLILEQESANAAAAAYASFGAASGALNPPPGFPGSNASWPGSQWSSLNELKAPGTSGSSAFTGLNGSAADSSAANLISNLNQMMSLSGQSWPQLQPPPPKS